MKILLTILCLTLFGTTTLRAQGDIFPVDEFGKVSCEELMAHVDNLGIQLTANKAESKSGYVIFLRKGAGATEQDWQMRFIHRILISRFGNQLNVTFLRKTSDLGPSTEFWINPPDVFPEIRKGLFGNSEVIFRIPFKIEKRTMFDDASVDPCSNFVQDGFVKMLQSDPTLTGYIVSINHPQKDRTALIKHFRDMFAKKASKIEGFAFTLRQRNRAMACPTLTRNIG